MRKLLARLRSPAPRRFDRVSLLSAAVVSFSLTLLGAGVGIGSGLLPLHARFSERVDIAAILLLAPFCALLLAVIGEVVRAMAQDKMIGSTRHIAPLSAWTPGDREG